ncbi:MAG TPA: ATP-binding protein, partial [Chryseolinea sp.]|nr:ATP-binding protein [Chryseolinea sp.]
QSIEGGTLNGSTLYRAKGSEYLVVNRLFTDVKPNVSQIMLGRLNPGRLEINLQPVLEPMEGGVGVFFHQGRQHFWVGQWSLRIVGYPIDPKTGMFYHSEPRVYDADPSNPNKIAGVGHLVEDFRGNLQVSNRAGIDIVSQTLEYGTNGSVRHIKSTKPNAPLIFVRDGKSVWTMNKGGKSIGIFHAGSDSIEQVFDQDDVMATLRNSPDGSLLIGTQNALYQAVLDGGRYKFQDEPIISNAEVNAIQEDRRGRLWIYADDRIICFDKSSKASTVFSEEDGVGHCRSVHIEGLHKTSEGIMISVGPNGFSVFDPATFKFSQKKVTPVLTMLTVNNTTATGKVIRGDDTFTIRQDITLLKELTVDYKHNNFSIEFSAMEMTAPRKNLYRHKLEGYDPDWIETDWKYRTATYTNLPPGDYTFRVKASNHHGVWSDHERALKVVILPPPWKSWWAYTGYALIFAALLVATRKNIVQRERLKSNLKLAKVEQEKEHFELEKAKEVDKVKSTFFANISHEFRTPLTLIKGPVQEMLEDFEDHPKVKERLKLVQRNADLVLKLINQLLDLAKLESGTLTVEKSSCDFNTFVSAIVSSFSSLAFQKNITLATNLPTTRDLVRLDKDKVETILINLINNAIKFTPSGGSVDLNATYENNSRVVFTITDNGIGIPEDQQGKVFERFHQVSEAHKEVGTGIGLALVKELVALMGGTISLISRPGKGSVFTVTLPIEQLDILTETESGPVAAEELSSEHYQMVEDHRDNGHSQLPHVLVIEDNTDLRKFIIDSLGKEFYFLEARDGKEGMEKAFEFVPDVIVSDVMMPEMDGITMTGKLKSDARTRHIPLILLTAKTSDESKLKGLGTGADDYLTKPFDKNELLLKVRNSIALHVKLREKIKLELLKEGPKTEVQSADEKFLYDVRALILSRLSDAQLSVESLAEEVALSRSQLLRKITALTGMSVNELIRTFRLQKAAQLLEQHWGPVTQVAYEVGFANLSYFSKVFKEQYGVLPSDYVAKMESP